MPKYYEILGVSKKANQKEIRQAYRRLARKFHPDLNPGDKDAEEKFKGINEAHQVLSSEDKRKKYDLYGDNWKHADQFEAARANPFDRSFRRKRGDDIFDSDLFGGLEDLLGGTGSPFGRGGTTATSTRIEVQATVTLEEAFSGTKRYVTFPSSSGERRVEVTIPPGVDTGSVVQVRVDKTNRVLIKVTVSTHPRFQRKGDDLYVDLELPFADAVLGGEAEMNTLGPKVSLKIPTESQNGQRIRLARQGMPKLGAKATRGDLYVTLRPKMPRNLTDEQRDLMRKFKDLPS